MIELKELTLGYGQRTLLETVNARITGGQLVALLGRNGCLLYTSPSPRDA